MEDSVPEKSATTAPTNSQEDVVGDPSVLEKAEDKHIAEIDHNADNGDHDIPIAPLIVSSSVPVRLSQEERRRKRRRLYRLLNNPDKLLPSFFRAIDVEPPFINLVDDNDDGDANTSATRKIIKEEDALPPVDENDFLVDPPTVVIDVDEYLGLKRKVKKEEEEEGPIMPSNGASPYHVASGGAASMLNPVNGREWVEGSRCIAMPEDATYLSEMQQWIRQNMEFFSATDDDVTMNRRIQTVRRRVGIRCIHCAKAMEALKKQQSTQAAKAKLSWPAGAVSYPVNFTAVYSNSIQKPQTHFEKCPYLPADSKLNQMLERSRANQLSNHTGFKKRNRDGMTAALYWTVSCRRLGLVETNNGIRFGRDLSTKPLPFDKVRAEVERDGTTVSSTKSSSFASPDRVKSSSVPVPSKPIELPKEVADVVREAMEEPDNPAETLTLREDHDKLSSYMFLALKQAAVCHAGPEDFATRGVRTKSLRLGYAGLACRHCVQIPSGFSCRKFSSSSDTFGCTVGTSFVPHLLECPYVPPRIQHSLKVLKKYHSQQLKMKHGSQGQFLAEMWKRIRAADKEPDPDQERLLLARKQAAREDSEYVPDGVESRAVSSRRGRRQSVSDSGPILPRNPDFPVSDNVDVQEVLSKAEENWDTAENDNLLMPEDKDLISDYLFLCVRQLKAAIPQTSDFRSNRRNTNLGSMAGFCCIHCADRSDKQIIQPLGRTFVSNPDGMAAAFNTSLYNHFLSCPGLPEELKKTLLVLRKLHSKQCASLPYGSQRRFFKRIFNRLSAIPVKSLFQEDDTGFPELMQKSSFAQRKQGTGAANFWQCMKCRMVPFEYRAPDAMFFVRPSADDMQRHAKACFGNTMCWDLVLSAMETVKQKYGDGSQLVTKNSFCELVRSVVGTEQDVYSGVLANLVRLENESNDVPETSLWRRLPTLVDTDRVQEAYTAFKSDLSPATLPDDFRACAEILELLQLLNCNFVPPPLPPKQSASSDKENGTEAVEEEPKTTLVASNGMTESTPSSFGKQQESRARELEASAAIPIGISTSPAPPETNRNDHAADEVSQRKPAGTDIASSQVTTLLESQLATPKKSTESTHPTTTTASPVNDGGQFDDAE